MVFGHLSNRSGYIIYSKKSTTMAFPIASNRRRSSVLFLTILVAGASLLFPKVGAKQTVGIMFLGMVFAWAFGSNRRIVHWLFVISGLALLAFSLTFYPTARLDVPQHASLEYTATVEGQTVRWDLDNGKWVPAAKRNDPPLSLIADYFLLEGGWVAVPGLVLLSTGIGLLLAVRRPGGVTQSSHPPR
jgi:hypothetical protein